MNLLRNASFNLIGALVPAVALFLTIPLIVHRLGADAYGALVLITSIVGYFGIIDVNATAGSVKYVAQYQASGRMAQAHEVVSFGLLLYVLIGLAGALALWLGAGALVNSVFKVPEIWRGEAVLALHVSALAFFVSQLQLYLQSVPQSLQRYDLTGKLDAVFGSLIPLVTIAVVLAGGGLVAIVAARLLVSLVHTGVLLRLLRRLLPGFRLVRPTRDTMRQVSSFSAYAYLQRIASVTYANADKLLIGAQHSMLALATYVIPYTLISRVFGILNRLTQSIFPMASSLAAVGDLVELKRIYIFTKRYTVFLNISVCLIFSIFSNEFLHYWLGKGVGESAPLIMVLVAYSLFLESLTNIPSLVNDGLGRPQISGLAAFLRVPIGLAATWWALSYYGIVMLAAAQLAVSAVLSIGFIVVVHRISLPWKLLDVVLPTYGPSALVLVTGTMVVFTRVGRSPLSIELFFASLILLIFLLASFGWFFVLSEVHRRRLQDVFLRKFEGRPS